MGNNDDERRIAEKLQKLVDAEWSEPRAISLDGPGPFELPVCSKPSILSGGPGYPFVLLLETATKSQRVRIPFSAAAIDSLRNLLNAHAITKGANGG